MAVASTKSAALTVTALLAAAVSCADATTSQCCEALLSAGLQPRLHLPGTATYQNRTTSYFSRSNFLHPQCLVQPETTEEVSRIVKALVAEKCLFAVRSGGHMPNAGANNIDDGITIDLGNMNTATYNAENGTASIQPGARWGQVYRTLEEQGITVAGGRAAVVGVAGFILGGGLSYSSTKKGMVCDSVLRYEVVLADGDVVLADKENHPDLFAALKGGSSNFGVVTRFDLEAFPSSPVWGGLVMYPETVGPQMIDALSTFTEEIDEDPASSSILTWFYIPALKENLIMAAYTNDESVVDAPAFKKYLAVQPQLSSTLRVTSWSGIAEQLIDPDGLEKSWFTLTFKNDVRIMHRAVEIQAAILEEMKELAGEDGFTSMCMLMPLPAVFGKHAVERGGNMLGLERLQQNSIMFLATLGTTDPKLASLIAQKVRAWVDAIETYAKSLDADIEFRFLNYAHSTQSPLESYGLENVAKMKKVAAKYDPSGVFQTLLPGGFKISQVGDVDHIRDEL